MTDKFTWKELKNIFKEKYKLLPLRDSKISNYISNLTMFLIASVISLLCALIASIAIKQSTFINTYAVLFPFITIITIIISFTLFQRNLYSIVIHIWKNEFNFDIPTKRLLIKLKTLIFLLTIKRYWFTILVSFSLWFILLICTFLFGYYNLQFK